MRRGLSIDGLACPAACGGRLRLIALIDQPTVVRRILEHLGHDAEPITPAPARAPPQNDDFDWGAQDRARNAAGRHSCALDSARRA